MSKGTGGIERKHFGTASGEAPESVISEAMGKEGMRSVVVDDHGLKILVYGPPPSEKTAGDTMSRRVFV